MTKRKVCLETHIAAFEARYPEWTWLLRDGRGTVDQADKYMCHLVGPGYMEKLRTFGHAPANLHTLGWGATPTEAFVNAVNLMEAA